MELTLSGPVGQVYALVVGNDLLFAGTQVIRFQYQFVFYLTSCKVDIFGYAFSSFTVGGRRSV